MGSLVAQPSDAGLIETFTDDGKPALRLTERGAQPGRALAMAGDADLEAVLVALLEDGD